MSLPELVCARSSKALKPSGRAPATACPTAHHVAPSPRPHCRPCLRDLEFGYGPVHGGKGASWHHHVPERGAEFFHLFLIPVTDGITSINMIGSARSRGTSERPVARPLFSRSTCSGPIGMNDTGFKLSQDHRARLAGMHARNGDGTLAPIEFEVPQEPEFQMGGGGLYGTASDYLAFQRVFLRRGPHRWAVRTVARDPCRVMAADSDRRSQRPSAQDCASGLLP